ncbi:MAG TPA: hypothetical protein PLZ57_10885 [Pseudobdellovibrionaceae bacterium]|nr:hypothetical protein [Pseudobdellovibrionaceae bacterium]
MDAFQDAGAKLKFQPPGSSAPTSTTSGHRLAAIDVGSNAIRLVVGEVDRRGQIHILKKYREGVRLGHDVFSGQGEISKKTLQRTVETFMKFRGFMREHGVKRVRAVATSALREAKNSAAVIQEIEKHSGVRVEVIDGLEEGLLIFQAISQKVVLKNRRSVMIDIGGGSVEISLAEGSKVLASQSFKLGTVRLLELLESRKLKEKHLAETIRDQFAPVRQYLREHLKGKVVDFAIGTGGNFECLGKLRVALLSKTSIYSMSRDELAELTEHLESMSFKERVQFLRLRPDRADVVVPAALVTLAIMDCVALDTLLIPHVGLRDGLLNSLR